MVEVLCTASKNFSCHDEDQILHLTPIEVASNFHDDGIKWKLMNTLFQRPEVKQAVSQQREFAVNSANAIMVGAALIAGVTYGGWLQPPLGYNTYYQFPEPLPAPPDTFESYMAIQGHINMQVFAVFNSLSFFCAVAAVVAANLKRLTSYRLFRSCRLNSNGLQACSLLQCFLPWLHSLVLESQFCLQFSATRGACMQQSLWVELFVW